MTDAGKTLYHARCDTIVTTKRRGTRRVSRVACDALRREKEKPDRGATRLFLALIPSTAGIGRGKRSGLGSAVRFH